MQPAYCFCHYLCYNILCNRPVVGDPDSRGRGENRKGVLLVALWIIAIILIIVFFPILFGVAATAAMVIIPLGIAAFGIGSIIYFAASAVTDPIKSRRMGLGVMIFYIFFQLTPILRWMYQHNNGFVYTVMPVAAAYAICLLMLSKNRGVGGVKGGLGMGFLLFCSVLETTVTIAGGTLWRSPYEIPVYLLAVIGYVLLLMVPAHSDTKLEETRGVTLITCGFLAGDAYSFLASIFFQVGVGLPSFLGMVVSYGTLFVILAGTALLAKSMLDGAKNKR